MNVTDIRRNKRVQLILGLLMGIVFGFLLQKASVTEYDVILGQLLLSDFTVVKVMFSAVLVGMIGLYLLNRAGRITYHVTEGSVGTTVIGGLIFGIGFALLGYCPGTVAGAIGSGWLDALFGGAVGIVIGAGLFATFYPRLKPLLSCRPFKEPTLYELIRVKPAILIPLYCIGIVILFFLLEMAGL
ncbi:MAG: YeeE/YedE family protein [Methanospirillaceae archaeon]|nr:YeeE/YedE family protein [Methanospirillaceae archaeon]